MDYNNGSNKIRNDDMKGIDSTQMPAVDSNNIDAAEKKPKKKNYAMAAGMVFLAILAMGGIGFGIWAWTNGLSQNKKNEDKIMDLRNQLAEATRSLEEESATVVDVEEVVTETSEDKWTSFSKGLRGQGLIVRGSHAYWDGEQYVQHWVVATKTTEGHLTIREQEADTTIMEMDNVLAMYYLAVGNGGVQYYYIISFDGSVSRVGILDSKIEKVGDYAKITTILPAPDLGVLLIDVDGNIYESY